jgi:uncharacterized membrane protein
VRWVLLDLLIVLLALGGLALVVLGLWRKVKDLAREVGRAGETVGAATEKLAELQAVTADRVPPGPTTSAVRPELRKRRK